MSRAPMAVAEDVEFVPLCMGAEDLADWRDLNRRIWGTGGKAKGPCDDCLLGYAAEMRALGRCNGEPGGDGGHEDIEEEEDMAGRMSPEGAARVAAAAKARAARQRAEREARTAASAGGVDIPALPPREERTAAGAILSPAAEAGLIESVVSLTRPLAVYTHPDELPNVEPVAPAEADLVKRLYGWDAPTTAGPDPLVEAYRVVREMAPKYVTVDSLLDGIARRIADRAADAA